MMSNLIYKRFFLFAVLFGLAGCVTTQGTPESNLGHVGEKTFCVDDVADIGDFRYVKVNDKLLAAEITKLEGRSGFFSLVACYDKNVPIKAQGDFFDAPRVTFLTKSSAWSEAALPDTLKNLGYQFLYLNSVVDAGMRVVPYPSLAHTDLKKISLSARNLRIRQFNNISSSTQPEPIRLDGLEAYQFSVTGVAKGVAMELTYLYTYVKTPLSLIAMESWVLPVNFDKTRSLLTNLIWDLKVGGTELASYKKNRLDKPKSDVKQAVTPSRLPACPSDKKILWTNCFGTFNFSDGRNYVGEYKDNFPHGQGTLTVPNVGQFVGEFREGNAHGKGRFSFTNGSSYVGEMKVDKPDGKGIWVYANGSKYTGEFKAAKYHGRGSFSFADGATYVGEYQEGARQGHGAYRFSSGDQYVGAWANNNYSGQGTFTFSNGEKYVGEFKDNKYHGQGSEFLANGDVKSVGLYEGGKLVKSRANAEQAKVKPAAPVGPRLSVHAIVIGNGAYQGSGRLDNPINDARSISAKLTSMGFKVTTVENADRTKLVSSLVKFSASAADSDLTLFFYAGHGVQISGTNYMLPTDTNLNQIGGVALHGISLNSVVEQFLPGKTKLVFLDACRDNPLLQVASRSVSRGLAPISVSQGTLISYATKDGSVAADGDGKNSPFTTALLQHIDTPEDIAVVLRKVRDQVMRDTGGLQQPWEYGSLSGGSLILSAIRAK